MKKYPLPVLVTYLPLISIFLLLFWLIAPYLVREFWFDEALTLMNFAWMNDPLQIYSSYIIPNNQIVYTIILHYWSMLPSFGLRQDFFFRLPSVLLAAGTLIVLYRGFKSTCGRFPLWAALAALAISPPFLIYATALRGYMASAFFVSIALVCARNWIRNGEKTALAGYFLACILCVGTIPSNLLALCGVVLYLLPRGGVRSLFSGRVVTAGLLPFAALGVVYLPILSAFTGVFKLGEGWSSPISVVAAWLVALVGVFGILLVTVLLPLVLRRKKWLWRREYSRILLILLPVAATFVLHKPPFPRVFFPLLPVIALSIADGLRSISALWRKRRWKPLIYYPVIACVIVQWGVVLQRPDCREVFSRYCGNASGDDFFYGYYVRKEHVPGAAAQKLSEFYAPGKIAPVYLSFASDPWPTMYYLLAHGYQSQFLFDGPRGPVQNLYSGMLVILDRAEKTDSVTDRFKVRLRLLFQTPKHSVFEVE